MIRLTAGGRRTNRRPVTVAAAMATLMATVMATITLTGACSSSKDATTTTGPTEKTQKVTTSTTPATTAPPPTTPPSPGTGGVTVTPEPVPIKDTTATVTVTWQGQQPRTLMFLTVCRKPTNDPTFMEGIDCSMLNELTPNGTPDGNGTQQLEVFRGEAPDGDTGWGCFAEGDQAPPGVQKNTTCYVRVTNDVISNKDDSRDAPFTITPG